MTTLKCNLTEIFGIKVVFKITEGGYNILATEVNGKVLPNPVPLMSREIPTDWDIEEKFEQYVGNMSIAEDSESQIRLVVRGSSGDHTIKVTKRDDMCILIDCRESGYGDHWIISPFDKLNQIVIMVSHIDETTSFDATQTIVYEDNGFVKTDTRRFS